MTSETPLDERYLDWLYSLVAPTRINKNPARSHFKLVEQLFKKEFLWFVPNDDNRIEDGKGLREEFIQATDAERDYIWLELGCSVLEMLIALCRHAEFESGRDAYYWFWRIMDNLGIRIYTDNQYDDEVRLIVDDAIEIMIRRSYRHDGVGGIFPLRDPEKDQRDVELWYQMSSYILENNYA